MVTTETASPRFAGIEDWSTAELVDGIIEGQFAAVGAVQAAAANIAAAADAAAARLARGGRLIYVGAGTSGRIATQDAAELPPTFNWPYERAVPVMAGGERALTHAAEGAEDDQAAGRQAMLDLGLGADDVVIGVAASGRTPYAVAALEAAGAAGALTIALFNNPGGRLGEVAERPILIATGAELLAGSTRMKAGTAQKIALNAFSTAVMVRLGFVYRGLMVEMRPTNAKLVERAGRMVAELAGCSESEAQVALEAADGSIKLATVMLVFGISAEAARDRLDTAGGNLRGALAPV